MVGSAPTGIFNAEAKLPSPFPSKMLIVLFLVFAEIRSGSPSKFRSLVNKCDGP